MGNLWNKLPDEIKVVVYLSVSAGLAELARQLELIQTDSVLVVAIINVVMVMLKVRLPQLKERLTA